MNGVAGFAFLAAFALLLTWSAVATRREQRQAELDVYRDIAEAEHADLNRAW